MKINLSTRSALDLIEELSGHEGANVIDLVAVIKQGFTNDGSDISLIEGVDDEDVEEEEEDTDCDSEENYDSLFHNDDEEDEEFCENEEELLVKDLVGVKVKLLRGEKIEFYGSKSLKMSIFDREGVSEVYHVTSLKLSDQTLYLNDGEIAVEILRSDLRKLKFLEDGTHYDVVA